MATVAAQTYITPQEYLALERKAHCKSEYIDGHIIAMAGASRTHNRITLDISTELNLQLRGKHCEVFSSDMRVQTSADDAYFYPDVVVVCGQQAFEDDRLDTLLNPIVIVEVLSPSTERRDRGEKFTRYKQLDSLQEYLLVAQDNVHVAHYRRHGAQWRLNSYRTLEEVLLLPSISCKLPLRDIYRRTTESRTLYGETS